jgi:hypothetical protein
MSKKVYPGTLDTTAAGSLRSGEMPIDGMIREATEEAGIPEEYSRANIKSCGSVTYQVAATNDGTPGCQHHVQFAYETELKKDFVPFPVDGEVDEFKLMSLEEVLDAAVKGKFKLNLAMTWVDYLVRHGIVTAENEPHFLEVCARLHRKHDIFVV